MQERLTIRSFAGIENVSVDIARITALIGPQASGKSVTAKLLYFFRNVWQQLFYSSDIDFSVDSRKEAVKDQFRRYFPPETWGGAVFVVEYEIGEHKILIRRAPSRGKPSDGLILYLPQFLDDLFKKMEGFINESTKKTSAQNFGYRRYEAWRRLEPELASFLGTSYFSSQLFVPAGRAFFSNIENNVFSFIARSEKKLDPFLAEFGEYFSIIKSPSYRRQGKKEFSTDLGQGLLGGSLVVEKDREYVQTKDGRSLPLGNLSSGQQEALPLLLMIEGFGDDEFFFGRGTEKSRHASYIEEPEAHLFPDFQRKVTEKIVEHALSKGGAQSLFMTTHSPYVLATLNNLLLAGRIGNARSREKRDALAAVVPQSQWLQRKQLSVYALSSDGCRSVMDDQSGLIDADYLDSVSTKIATTFESLLEIEFPSGRMMTSHVLNND